MDFSKPFIYILEIAKHRSISAAADHLNIKQPALSKLLRKFELELGAELFDRSTNPIKLTEAGKCFVECAKRIVDADSQLRKELSELQAKRITIRLGISPSRAPYLLPIILTEFANANINADIVIDEGGTENLNNALMNGNNDLIITLKDGFNSVFFEKQKLFNETVYLAVPKSETSNSFNEIVQKRPIISPGKGQNLSELLRYFPAYSSNIECQNIITALSLVKAGQGVTLIPSYMADFGDTHDINIVRVPDCIKEKTVREVCVFFRKEQFLTSAEKQFIECAVKATNH